VCSANVLGASFLRRYRIRLGNGRGWRGLAARVYEA
jgi:hypothetical protein